MQAHKSCELQAQQQQTSYLFQSAYLSGTDAGRERGRDTGLGAVICAHYLSHARIVVHYASAYIIQLDRYRSECITHRSRGAIGQKVVGQWRL